jgi:DNA modification methylase
MKNQFKILSVHQIKDNWKENKITKHSLHYICSRICSLPPEIPYHFITKYSKRNQFILDPFSGKGTVPLEACLNERIGIGNDISPEAFVLTHAKVRPVPLNKIEKFLIELSKEMGKIKEVEVSDELDKKAKIFYSKSTFEQILKIREILMYKNSDTAIFVKAVLCGILHGNSKVSLSLPCSHSFSMSPNYVKKYSRKHHLRKPYRDVIKCVLEKCEVVLKDGIPSYRGVAFNEDSRNLPLNDECVDMIITSPPYFNLNTYAWDNWLRLWFLGYNYRNVKKLLIETGSKIKYKKFMEASLAEMFRVLKKDSKCFIVVGDVNINNKTINTAKFLIEPALKVGFNVDSIIVDTIPKYKKHFIYLKNNNGIKKDRVLCLSK